MPQVVTVRRTELLAKVRENRDNHRTLFLRAQAAFRERVIAELDQSLRDARNGSKIRLFIQLPEPEDHTADYDREIAMLEMEIGDTVVITSALFDQVVMDRWGWSERFVTTNATYGVS